MSRPVTGSETTPAHSIVIQGNANATKTNANRPGFIRLNPILLISRPRSTAAWSVSHRLAKGQATLSGAVFDPAPSALSACSAVHRQGDLLTNRTPVSIMALCRNSTLTPSPDTRGQTPSLEVLQVCRSTLRARWVCTVFMPHIHCLRRRLQSWDPTESNNLQQISRK